MNRHDPIFKLLAKAREEHRHSRAVQLSLRKLFEEFDRIDAVLPKLYDSDFGDDLVCCCGHPYYRHFDGYDDQEPVGCKYCICDQWHEPIESHDHSYDNALRQSDKITIRKTINETN